MNSPICPTLQLPLHVENYDSARIEMLKNTGKCKEILYDKAISWRVFCNTFYKSNPDFGTLTANHQMHVHYPLVAACKLQAVVELIRDLFVEAVDKGYSLTFWIEEKGNDVQIKNLDEETATSAHKVIDYNLRSFGKLIEPLYDLLICAGARKVDFNLLSNRVHRIDVEWKSNPTLRNIDKKRLYEERAEAQYTLIMEALGGFQAVKALPIVDSCLDVTLVTAPVMRSKDYAFFVFRYIVRDEDQGEETIRYTSLVNILKVPSISNGDNNGWEVIDIGGKDDPSEHSQFGPAELNSSEACLELTCGRIKRLMQNSPVGILDHKISWFEDDELISDGRSAVELV